MLLKIRRWFKMANYKYQKCGKIWHGLAQSDICPNCGGKLEKLEKGEGWKNK
jgi:rRNA maturation endonuclease Nob1